MTPEAKLTLVVRQSGAVLPPAERTIDLQQGLDGLRALRSEVEAYYFDLGTMERQHARLQITTWMRMLAERALAIEYLILQFTTPHVAIRGHEGDVASLVECLDHATPLEQVRRLVATALSEADCIVLAAAAGRPLRR